MKKYTPKISLFMRIMLRLCFPLFILGSTITALQLTNQINTLNELHRIESQWAFERIQGILEQEFKEGLPSDLLTLKRKIEDMKSAYGVLDIEIFNAIEKNPILDKNSDSFLPSEEPIERSLRQRAQSGASYWKVVDRKNKRLTAYIPLQTDPHLILVARVTFSLAGIKDALVRSRRSLLVMLFFILLTGIAIGHGLAQSIVKPIQALNKATQEIMKGNLGQHVGIKTGDEIELLAHTFNRMSETLQTIRKHAEDANPLTGLPGNQGIFREVQKRIYEHQKFVLFHADLDRFKVFNDHFGLAKGDEAIKRTAELIKKMVRAKGAADDFIGHQGGDDFILITRPQQAAALGEMLCRQFDEEVVRTLYKKEDLERGHTLHLDRRRLTETGEEIMIRFPLLAISLAGVSNAKRDFADYFDCMSATTEVKTAVKKDIKSSFKIQE